MQKTTPGSARRMTMNKHPSVTTTQGTSPKGASGAPSASSSKRNERNERGGQPASQVLQPCLGPWGWRQAMPPQGAAAKLMAHTLRRAGGGGGRYSSLLSAVVRGGRQRQSRLAMTGTHKAFI